MNLFILLPLYMRFAMFPTMRFGLLCGVTIAWKVTGKTTSKFQVLVSSFTSVVIIGGIFLVYSLWPNSRATALTTSLFLLQIPSSLNKKDGYDHGDALFGIRPKGTYIRTQLLRAEQAIPIWEYLPLHFLLNLFCCVPCQA